MQCGLDSALREERPDHVPSEHWLQLWGPGTLPRVPPWASSLPSLCIFSLAALRTSSSPSSCLDHSVLPSRCCDSLEQQRDFKFRMCPLPSYHPRVCPAAFHLGVNNYASPIRNTGQFPSQGHPVHLPPRSLPLPCAHWMDSSGSAGRTGGPEQKGWAFGLYFKANKGVLELQGLSTGRTVEGKYISKPEWKWFWCSFCLSFKKEKPRNITLWF